MRPVACVLPGPFVIATTHDLCNIFAARPAAMLHLTRRQPSEHANHEHQVVRGLLTNRGILLALPKQGGDGPAVAKNANAVAARGSPTTFAGDARNMRPTSRSMRRYLPLGQFDYDPSALARSGIGLGNRRCAAVTWRRDPTITFHRAKRSSAA